MHGNKGRMELKVEEWICVQYQYPLNKWSSLQKDVIFLAEVDFMNVQFRWGFWA